MSATIQELAEALGRFLGHLPESDTGRALLAKMPGRFHIALSAEQSIEVAPDDGKSVRVQVVGPSKYPRAGLTRLEASGPDALLQLADGSASFADALIPVHGVVGHLRFVDNWMARKNEIGWLGQAIRTAQSNLPREDD